VSVIRVSEPANRNAARGLGTTFARWPRVSEHCRAQHCQDRNPAPGARGRSSKRRRYGERRSAKASVPKPTLPRAAQREGVFPPAAEWWGCRAAGWRGGGVRGGAPPPPRPPGFGVGRVPGGGPSPPRHLSLRHNHLSSEQSTNFFLFRKGADSDRLDELFLSLRHSVSPEQLPDGQI